jgi:hypothetical protein
MKNKKTSVIDYPVEIKELLEQLAAQIRSYGRFDLKDGHSLFEYNLQSKVLKEYELYIKFLDPVTKKVERVARLKMEDDCLYFGSLNKVNATKKLLKIFTNLNRVNHEINKTKF